MLEVFFVSDLFMKKLQNFKHHQLILLDGSTVCTLHSVNCGIVTDQNAIFVVKW